ncbi:MAG: M14 family metallopeptidase [Bacteroidales bacterium]
MKLGILMAIIALANSFFAMSQSELLTTAEKTNFESTSTYEEVVEFIQTLDRSSDILKLENFATTVEGRDIPLMIIADPMPANHKEIKNDDRIVVYIQANIHPGEVEGKEATQMLARDLLKGKNTDVLKNVILLICPNLNADGNEKFSTKNRTNQNGPINGVGVRHNGQFLDLNRDGMKLETPEIRGVVTEVFNKWDPAITVDCHTTNGSYHEEPVTFTWMMNPNGDRKLINYMRDQMMPSVHRVLWDKYDVENVFYGEFLDRMNVDTGWTSYACEPRYLVNYVGVRNRLAILNENYVYADFKTRVNGSYHLLLTILEFAAQNNVEIKKMLNEADERLVHRESSIGNADSFAIEYTGVPTPEKITIKAIEADTIPGMKGYWRYKQSDRKRTVTVDYIADYFATVSTKMPFAYILSVPDPDVLDLLITHGIRIEKLEEGISVEVEQFNISELNPTKRPYQGHYMNTIKGDFETVSKNFDKETYIIKTAQPLGNLAAYFFEPLSDDGLVKWNFLDRYLVPQWGSGFYPYPIYRLMQNSEIKTTKIN